MNGLRKKVLVSAVVLVFAFVATIGSTYAWFTVSNQVTATLDISVQSAESLLIKPWQTGDLAEYEGTNGTDGSTYSDLSFDLSEFKSTVTLGAGTGYYEDIADWDLFPVTCLKGETQSGDPLTFATDYNAIDITNLRYLSDPVASANRPLTPATPNDSAGHFIELKFWLLRTSGGEGNNKDVTLNATVTGDYPEAVFIGALGDDDTNYANDNQWLFGSELDFNFRWTGLDAGFDTNGAYNYATNWSNLAGDTAGTLQSTVLPAVEGAGKSVIYLQQADVPELLTVRIWIEGWDEDTTNAIMSSEMEVLLQFTLTTVV